MRLKRGTDVDTMTSMSYNSPVAPSVGMVFGSWEDVEDCFSRYAKREGFAVIRVSRNRRRDGVNEW